MDFALNDDRRMLSETLERFLADNYDIEKRHGLAMQEHGFSKEMWAQFAELGIIGALFNEASGGYGGEGDDFMVVFEALGRHLVVEPFLPSLLAGSILAETKSQADILESLISGEQLLALAHGEPASRYELSSVSTKAKQEGDSWFITGNKSVVLGGGAANHLIVSARTSGAKEDEAGISVFLVEKNQAVTTRNYSTLDGYGASEVMLENAQGILLGQEGNGFALIEKAYAKGIIAISAEALGAMHVATDLTVEYTKQRKQFGIPIGKFQALQHRMADMLIELEQMRSSVINAAGNINEERNLREQEVSACKYLVGTIGRQIAEEAIQIHGGMGMTWEYAVGHFAKHITMIDHVFGDTDHHLERYIALGR